MLNHLRSYILETDFKITILKNKIDIVNYTEIDHFDDTKIIIRFKEGHLIIKGENLTISKLLNDELLIIGKAKTIDFQ